MSVGSSVALWKLSVVNVIVSPECTLSVWGKNRIDSTGTLRDGKLPIAKS
jgi:hypothetical protein